MDVQLVLLRALAGMGARTQETPLKAGMVLPARVLPGGMILLAGVRLAASLPPGLEPGVVRAVAHVPAGEVAERLRSASGDLRASLSGALGMPATVDIVAHAGVFDAAA